MFSLSRKLLTLLQGRERWHLALILAVMLMVAVVEVAGVGSVLPFISVLADPGIIQEKQWLSFAYNYFQFDSTDSFLFTLGIMVIVLIVLTIGSSALLLWLGLIFSLRVNYRMSVQLLKSYVNLSYEYFITINTAHLSRNILGEVGSLTQGVLLPLLQALAKSIVSIFVFTLLFAIEPVLSTGVGLSIGVTYAIIYVLVRRKLRVIGEARLRANASRYKLLSETFYGFKELKVLGREGEYVREFATTAREFLRYPVLNQLFGQMPRFGLEILAFGGMMAVILYLMATRTSLEAIVPVLTLFAVAAYRLLPALQTIFRCLAQVRFGAPVLDLLYEDLVSDNAELEPRTDEPAPEVRSAPKEITLCDVTYSYPAGDRPAIEAVSLRVPRNATVGLVGTTGSGKSTTADIILGLLQPQKGEVRIDGVPIRYDNLREWLDHVGYVPQHIFLCDDTIARNIAFGVPRAKIDMERVKWAARLAALDEFLHRLPDGFETRVGERGVRLSGGQLQRVGIARALYNDPGVLVFDEATSAIDSNTEAAVMRSLRELSGRKTIILIAHRISTVRHADIIYRFDHGHLVEAGTYDELVESSSDFRKLARIS